jgi:tRNA pseudouridine(38-40) synthase
MSPSQIPMQPCRPTRTLHDTQRSNACGTIVLGYLLVGEQKREAVPAYYRNAAPDPLACRAMSAHTERRRRRRRRRRHTYNLILLRLFWGCFLGTIGVGAVALRASASAASATRRPALLNPPAKVSFRRGRPLLSSKIVDGDDDSNAGPAPKRSSALDPRHPPNGRRRRALLLMMRISYDGRAFTGWSAANDPNERKHTGNRSSVANRGAPSSSSSSSVRSVQGEIVQRLRQLYGGNIRNDDDDHYGVSVVVDSCSRTDRGVHASGGGMVALAYAYHRNNTTNEGFELPDLLPIPMEPARVVYALNRMLPGDVRITGMATVERINDYASPTTADRSATVSGNDGTHNETLLLSSTLRVGMRPPIKLRNVIANVRKTYRYRFSTGTDEDPLSRRISWHVPTAMAILESDGGDAESVGSHSCSRSAPLDMDKMHTACRILEGTHNFRAFQAGPRGSEIRNPQTVCTIESVTVTIASSPSASAWTSNTNGGVAYKLEVTGDRFLYKMVRLMVGCVVAVGQGRIAPELLERALLEGTTRDDWPEFQCAPAHGLALVDVQFDTQPGWDVTWL